MFNNLFKKKIRANPKVQPDSGNDEALQLDSDSLKERCETYKKDKSLMPEVAAQRLCNWQQTRHER